MDVENNAINCKTPRFFHLFGGGENFSDIGVSRLPVSEDDYDNEQEIKDNGNICTIQPTVTNLNELQLIDKQLEPTPPCNSTKNYIQPPKVKRQSVKHKIEECTPTVIRRRPKQMRPRAIYLPDYFFSISDEVVLQIFQWLPRFNLKQCALTCKRFRRLAYDESLWKSLNLGCKNITPENVNLIINRGIVALRLAKADLVVQSAYSNVEFSDSLLDCDLSCVNKLRHLDLSMASVTPDGIATILSICKSLRNISLEHCEINDQICKYLSRNSELEQLNLAMCSGITTKGLKRILTYCFNLSAVNLAWTNLDLNTVEMAVCNFPCSITKLNLSGCRETLTDNHVTNLLDCCPMLEELDLSDSGLLTEAVIISLSTRVNCIKSLSLSRCFNISPQYYSLIDKLPSLTHLDLHGLFTSQGVDFLKNRYSKLQINQSIFSTIARPTTGLHRTSIWENKVYD